MALFVSMCLALFISQLLGKDPDAGKYRGQEEKEATDDEMVGWHHRLDGHEFEQAPVKAHIRVCAQSLQLCPALCDPTDCGPQAPLSKGILQARKLE